MKLTSKQARHICTNPKAHMDFVLRGAVPSEKPAPMTPLRQLMRAFQSHCGVSIKAFACHLKWALTAHSNFEIYTNSITG